MHDSVMDWVRAQVDEHELRERRVLDVGSLDVNGNVRPMFNGDYTGIDMREGPNVDQVVNAHDIVETFGSESFDVVVCCEMLEHDTAFWVSMKQIAEVLRPGGRLLLTTRGLGFPLHEYPHDLWRFTVDAGVILLKMGGLSGSVEEDPQAPGIFISGVKNG